MDAVPIICIMGDIERAPETLTLLSTMTFSELSTGDLLIFMGMAVVFIPLIASCEKLAGGRPQAISNPQPSVFRKLKRNR